VGVRGNAERPPDWGSGGRRFKSCLPDQNPLPNLPRRDNRSRQRSAYLPSAVRNARRRAYPSGLATLPEHTRRLRVCRMPRTSRAMSGSLNRIVGSLRSKSYASSSDHWQAKMCCAKSRSTAAQASAEPATARVRAAMMPRRGTRSQSRSTSRRGPEPYNVRPLLSESDRAPLPHCSLAARSAPPDSTKQCSPVLPLSHHAARLLRLARSVPSGLSGSAWSRRCNGRREQSKHARRHYCRYRGEQDDLGLQCRGD
jgi:hypothetical protein